MPGPCPLAVPADILAFVIADCAAAGNLRRVGVLEPQVRQIHAGIGYLLCSLPRQARRLPRLTRKSRCVRWPAYATGTLPK
jgi:hypothetical protein